jgi:hypothetical protein
MREGTSRRAALVALLALLGACGERSLEATVASTKAAVVISSSSLVNNTAPIPGNGSLLIWTPSGDEPSIDVRSTAAPAGSIAGSSRKLASYWVWTANVALPEGSYTVSISDPSFPGVTEYVVEITGERAFQKPVLTSEPQIAIHEQNAEYACCWSLTNGVRVEGSCFAVEWQEGVLLSTNVATSESPSALTQLLFQITPAMQPGFIELTPFGGAIAFSFDTQADEYCFDISAIEITTGELYTFDELERCVPHDVRALTMRAAEPSATDLDPTICPAPPDGFEASWCELNEEPCAAEPDRVGCELAGHVCRGEPLPGAVTTGGTGGMTSSAGAGGASGMSGESGSGGDDGTDPPSGDGDGDRDEPSPSEPEQAEDQGLRSAGCGCRVYPARETSAWLALAMLGAAIGRLRSAARSRSRASRDPGRSP